ncbi:MAG: cbb3-type cytochrome c oxidase subunit II, partial [Burkholderiaceae bacterium]
DLHRIGGKYTDEWQRLHLESPRDLVPESNMPAYPWLANQAIDAASVPPRLLAMQRLGVPYTDAEIAASAAAVKDRTELDALVAYLQSLGTLVK